ncbi:MAG: DUF4062 domain-containing protein, partial [Verrucomicrobiota bacterium]
MAEKVLSIFVSAVTKEFGSYREEVAKALRERGFVATVQTEFNTGSGTLLEKLDAYIQSCDAVVCLIGNRYGAAPGPVESAPLFESAHSYTQCEYLLARRYHKPVFVFHPESDSTDRDTPSTETEEETQKQNDFWETEIVKKGIDRTPFASLAELIRGVLICDFSDREQTPSVPVDLACPYVGLRRFGEVDSDYFFGRAGAVRELETRLAKAPMLLVMGNSGSGKSSLIRAGLIPDWKRKQKRTGFADPVSIVMSPGSQPFDELWAAAIGAGFESEDSSFLRDGGETVFVELIENHLEKQGSRQPCLIAIDQFEELFTRIPEAEKSLRESFVAALVNLVEKIESLSETETSSGEIGLILSMRDDFFGDLGKHENLTRFADRNIHRISSIKAEELRDIIEIPARRHGVFFQKGLTQRIIAAVEGRAGMLPMLQYTLRTLWQAEKNSGNLIDGEINTETYEQLGGVEGALQKRVSDYYESKSEQDQAAIRTILLSLVDPDRGSEAVPVSREAKKESLLTSRNEELFKELVDREKLLISREKRNGSVIELAHEALIRGWTDFSKWVEEHKEAVKVRNRLEEDAATWDSGKSKRSVSYIMSDAQFENVKELRQSGELDRIRPLQRPETEFLKAYEKWKRAQATEAVRKATRLAAAASVVALALSVLAWHSFKQSEKAKTQTEVANENLQVANEKIASVWHERGLYYERTGRPMAAALMTAKGLGFEGFGRAQENESFKETHEQFLFENWETHRESKRNLSRTVGTNLDQIYDWKTEGHRHAVTALAWDHTDTYLASGSEKGVLFIWNQNGTIHTRVDEIAFSQSVTRIDWSPDGEHLVFDSASGALLLANSSGRIIKKL